MATKLNTSRAGVIFISCFAVLAAATWTAPLSAQTKGKGGGGEGVKKEAGKEVKKEGGEEVKEEAKDQAADLFFEGVLLFDQGKYAAALDKFSKSYDLHHHWKTLYNIGMCYLEMSDLPNAASMLSKFLEGGAGKIQKDLVEDVARTLKDIKLKVGIMRLTGHYEGGVLTIDGVENPGGAQGEDVFVTPGVHHVQLARGTDVLVDKKITIEGGEIKEIFVVEPKPSEVTKGTGLPPKEGKFPSEEEKREMQKRKTLKSTGWAFFGLSLAFLAAGGATGIVALVGKNDVEEMEDSYIREYDLRSKEELDRMKQDRDDKYSAAMNSSFASTAFFCAGGVTAFISFILLPLGYRKAGMEKKTDLEKKADLDLHVAPDSLGISVRF
jgi:hypothetical protein